MNLETSIHGDVIIVVVPVERFDASNSREFKKLMEPILEQSAKVAVDLSAVKFMDSSGLGALLSSLRVAATKQAELKLFGMRAKVRTLFELVRMHHIFEIVETQEDAIDAFK